MRWLWVPGLSDRLVFNLSRRVITWTLWLEINEPFTETAHSHHVCHYITTGRRLTRSISLAFTAAHSNYTLALSPYNFYLNNNVWPWQRWQGKLQTHLNRVALLTKAQGLGKGGAKRHRKILRDNIQGQCGKTLGSQSY